MANKRPDDFKGFDITSPINRIPAGRASVAQNVRAYIQGGFKLRNPLSAPILTLDASVQSLIRMNDTTPAGPPAGFVLISETTSGKVFAGSVSVASGLSGNATSNIPFRPNASVQPWDYIGDSAPNPNVTVDSGYNTNGMIKVRSDGLSRKMGIKEPQVAPTVSTSGIVTTGSLTLNANTPPWTNHGGVNGSYNYAQTTTPGTGGVGNIQLIALPAGSQTIQLAITGSAVINGATHAPGDLGPTSSAYPGQFDTFNPATIALGAFTDSSGNVLASGGMVPIVISAGTPSTWQVPSGATQLQLGIDSQDPASGTPSFATNTGSFLVNWTLTVSSIATKVSTLGPITAYVWGDSPHSGPVATYIWKNPNDSASSGIARTIGTAQITVSNNSWVFDSTPEDGTVPVQWSTLDPTGATISSIPLFSPALESQGFQDFNSCVVGSLFIPTAGQYTFTFQFKDQILVGFGAGVASGLSGAFTAAANNGQTKSVVSNLPLVFIGAINGSGGHQTGSVTMTFASSQSVQVEIDWDYWEHTGRSVIMTCNGAVIPPLPAGVRTNVVYWGVYRASETGATSNPSPASSPVVTPVLGSTVVIPFSPDPQVDKVDYYRQDSGLANPTYVGTGPNTNPPTPIDDTLSDLAVANNPTLEFDNFEPVPSIDLPRSGTCNVSGGVITQTGGDLFNIRWLAGTIILIGAPPPYGQPVIPQVAYTLIARPISPTQMTIPGVLDGLGLKWNIAEPKLANQPMPYLFGPTDNINYAFAVGDPLRPGTLYWSKGSNLDSWPDTNQQDVTDPSEALVNGAMSAGVGVVFSIKRAWMILPNFFNALATVTGTEGSTWTLQATAIDRGLFIPRCVCVAGGGRIFFRVDDGIHTSVAGSASVSITDNSLYPLFPHESPGVGVTAPVPVSRNGVTIIPPDDSDPDSQKFYEQNGYLYYDYEGTDGAPHTLVYDIIAEGWVWDQYSSPATAHAANEGQSAQGILVGCSDGTIRQMAPNGTEFPVTGLVFTPAIGGPGWQHIYEMTVEYSSNAIVSVSGIAADVGNGSYGIPTVTLPSTGGKATKTTFKVGPNKWKWMWFGFLSVDPTLAVYLDGFAVEQKPWGANTAYKTIQPFKPNGGVGAQP